MLSLSINMGLVALLFLVKLIIPGLVIIIRVSVPRVLLVLGPKGGLAREVATLVKEIQIRLKATV